MTQEHKPHEELREAFEAWSKEHGVVWFSEDVRLANAIAKVCKIDLVWSDEIGIKERVDV